MADFTLPFSVDDALAIAREASGLALSMHADARVEVKGDSTLVTDADRAVEKLLRAKLGDLAPSWSFLGEETGLTGDPDAPSWVIDPIDGTTNFARGIPTWCISIGAVFGGEPVFGILVVPELDETYWSVQGQGAWKIKNEKTRRLSVIDALPLAQEDPIAGNTTVERIIDFGEVPNRLRNFGSLAYHLALLAQGSLVANIAHYHKLYDVAAGLCLCFEAGCQARYLTGERWEARVSTASETTPMLCAPPQTLEFLLSNLKLKVVPEVSVEEIESRGIEPEND
ncbi:histidinol-phosphatase [Abditibacteriota bacterium]|nr:histidinol-phosphatase [Abditibacteriota bacterium]